MAVIAALRQLGKTTPVLILSAIASLDEQVRGLRGGEVLNNSFWSGRPAPIELPLSIRLGRSERGRSTAGMGHVRPIPASPGA